VIDTHAHLDACSDRPSELLVRARAAGVQRVVTIGTGVASGRASLEIAVAEDGVFAAIGVHPHDAGMATKSELAELEKLLGHPRAVAVGETGLDYYRDYAPRDRQRAVFEAHVGIAVETGKALVVHTRAAETDTLAVLTSAPESLPVILHCFSSPPMLQVALERRWYVSFAGNVTYPKAPELREAAQRVPADRLLAETDCPYLAPQPLRGRPNEPAYVVHTVAALAAAREEDPRMLEQRIDDNATRVFGLP
jgi:TatD DNase family protein